MTSSDYRRIAREKLAGNWGIAILATLVAGILGAAIATSGFSFNVNIDAELIREFPEYIQRILISYLSFAATVGGILGLIQFILGGVVRLGYCQYLLNLHDGKPSDIKDLFSQFHRFGDGFCLALLQGIFIALWSLLFVIPGIVASYRYAMAPFVMLENPDMTASEAIEASKQMMNGHKGELFCLDLSFIGWSLLNIFTLGIGSLWLNPYMNMSWAAFFRSFRKEPVE